MRTFDVDSMNGLIILQTKLRRSTLILSTCANKALVEGYSADHIHFFHITGDENLV